jgi:sugar phosphate isomerase/epimerase
MPPPGALGIERLSVFNMPPVEFVRLTAELDCNFVGIALAPTHGYNPHGYPDWSLRDDAQLRRDLVAATRDVAVDVALVEGFAILPGEDVRGWEYDLDLVRELGCARIAVASVDKDPQRTVNGIASLSEMAADRGLTVCAEIGSMRAASRLGRAVELANAVAMQNFSLLIDTMHFFRLGSTLDGLAALDPALIGYVQLCDAPWDQRFDTYMEEALYERMAPGDGDLPLRAFIATLPATVPVSLEIPQRSLTERGVGHRKRLAPCVAAARSLLKYRQPERN